MLYEIERLIITEQTTKFSFHGYVIKQNIRNEMLQSILSPPTVFRSSK